MDFCYTNQKSRYFSNFQAARMVFGIPKYFILFKISRDNFASFCWFKKMLCFKFIANNYFVYGKDFLIFSQ
jgi:hypothetical protein